MKFTEAFIKESLRFWGALVERTCNQDYHIPEVNVTIPKGVLVQIAGKEIMFEERFFPDPHKFDPEAHFDSQTLIPTSFFPFGQGPRGCIGMRFAWVIMKSLLIRLVANYKILPGPGMKKTFVVDPLSISGLPKEGIHVKLEARV